MTPEQCIDIPVELEESSKKCHRVPRIFPRNLSSNEDCYNPLVVSIGPYHHNDPTHELAEMQSLKNEMLEQFVNKSGKPREVLKRDVAESANSARKCYDEGSTKDLDDNAFTEMMLLDGCFILQFIFCFLHDFQNLKLSNRVLAYFVKRDLFLLENQLPYEVLTKLMSLGFGDAEGKKLMEDFMEEVRGLPRDKSRDKENGKGLDCRFWSWRPAPKMNNQPRQIPQPGEITQPGEIPQPQPQPVHLLDYFHNRFMGGRGQENSSEMVDGQWSSYRSVMELKSVGIHFKPSKTDKYTDLQYKSTLHRGTVTLPRIVIDDCTKSLLLNLLAHEACPGSAEGFWVTSYVYFMDSLIDHPEDVKERDVKSSIEKHCKAVTKKWVAEWLHAHFSSPWTFLAFLGAIVALVLTFIQTYKTDGLLKELNCRVCFFSSLLFPPFSVNSVIFSS